MYNNLQFKFYYVSLGKLIRKKNATLEAVPLSIIDSLYQRSNSKNNKSNFPTNFLFREELIEFSGRIQNLISSILSSSPSKTKVRSEKSQSPFPPYFIAKHRLVSAANYINLRSFTRFNVSLLRKGHPSSEPCSRWNSRRNQPGDIGNRGKRAKKVKLRFVLSPIPPLPFLLSSQFAGRNYPRCIGSFHASSLRSDPPFFVRDAVRVWMCVAWVVLECVALPRSQRTAFLVASFTSPTGTVRTTTKGTWHGTFYVLRLLCFFLSFFSSSIFVANFDDSLRGVSWRTR